MDFLIALALATTTLAVPGRTNANVSVASDGAAVDVVWAASAPSGATDIYSAASTDGGRTFAAPVRVNDVDGDARVTGEQPPHVALATRSGKPPSVIVVWTTKGTSGTKLLQARSDDGGLTFGHSTVVPGADAAGNRGWESLTVGSGGAVDAVWLDHREMTGHESHMSPEQSKLYFASLDGSAAPRALTGGVCYCCKTAVAAGPDGSIYTAWRHVYPGNVRDIAFTTSHDGGRSFASPIRVSEDHWILDGCPDDGPAIAVDRQNRVHVVWPTLVHRSGATSKDGDPTIALFYAMSTDGRQFTPRQQLPTDGLPHHPQIAIGADGALAFAWDELKDAARHAVVASATVDARGKAAFRSRMVVKGTPAIYPVIASVPDGVLVAWTSGTPAASVISIERVP
ncbi:MAG TPA: sialidase family protein [Vicinamibacterales bacterium]|jgi:hypothetical protein